MSRIIPVLIFSLSAAFAQYTTGRIEGTITGPDGQPVSAAKLTLTSLENAQSRTLTATDTGTYFFPAVNPGVYRLEVSKDSFATAAARLTVLTSQTLTHNFTLALATQSTTVEVVESAAALLNTFEPQRSVTRSALEIQTLPNANRNIVNMITLSPGVTPTFNPRGGSLTTLNIAQAGQLNANGGRSKATAHQLDSTDANDWEFGGIALSTQPTPDMLQEFKVLASNWAAEYGVKSNAQVLMVTRSGTNSLHGSAYNFLQNSALNARDYFDPTGKATPLRQNFYGLTAGGPLRKDSTFLFGGWESRRTRGSSPVSLLAVPTEAARATVTDPTVRSILPLLPLPSAPTANPRIGTIAASVPSPSESDQFLLRGDQYLGTHTITLRYFQNIGTSFNRTAGSLPQFDATFDPKGRNAMAADTWVINPATTNELRLSYGRASALFNPATEPVTARFIVAGLAGFGTVQFWPQGRIFNTYQIADVVSHVRGRHILKAGIDLRRIQDNSINDSSRRGVYNFASIDTFLAGTPSAYSQVFGNTYRGFRMDYHGFFIQDDFKISRTLTLNLGLRYEYQSGLSEVNQLQSVLDPRVNAAIGQAGTGPLGGFRNEKPVVEGNPALFAPRLGFAWNPKAGPMSIRGGYGIYYDSQLFNGLQAGRTTPPINYSGALAAAQITGANSFANLLAGTAQVQRDFAGQIGGFGTLRNLGGITSQLPEFRNPYSQHFTLGVQRRIASSMVFDLAYVATKGTALTTLGPGNATVPSLRPAPATSLADEQARLAQFQQFAARVNGTAAAPASVRLDPRFNTVNLIRDNGSSIYHSLQTEFRKTLSKGLMIQAGYTWSRSIDNGSDYSPGQATTDRGFAQDQFNYQAERGPSSYDIPHRFILSHVWQLPFYNNQADLKGRILGGWTFASINQWQTGIPYTVMSGARLGLADVNMDGDISGAFDNARASCVPGGNAFTFGKGVAGIANLKYVQPLLGNHGTCGRNTERMNNLLNYDWTFSKNVRLYERIGVEFRTDLFNIFNVPFLTAAGDDFRNLSSPNFARANAAAPSRRVQMSLRLVW
jgi:hypothetical protein